MTVPPPAGTGDSKRTCSASSGSGPAPAAGGLPPRDRAASAHPPRPATRLAPTPTSHPGQLAQASRPQGRDGFLVWVCGVGGQRGPVSMAEHLGTNGVRAGLGQTGPRWVGAAHQSHERQGSFWQGLVRQRQQQQQEGQPRSVALEPQPGHLHAAQTLSSAADCSGPRPLITLCRSPRCRPRHAPAAAPWVPRQRRLTSTARGGGSSYHHPSTRAKGQRLGEAAFEPCLPP